MSKSLSGLQTVNADIVEVEDLTVTGEIINDSFQALQTKTQNMSCDGTTTTITSDVTLGTSGSTVTINGDIDNDAISELARKLTEIDYNVSDVPTTIITGRVQIGGGENDGYMTFDLGDSISLNRDFLSTNKFSCSKLTSSGSIISTSGVSSFADVSANSLTCTHLTGSSLWLSNYATIPRIGCTDISGSSIYLTNSVTVPNIACTNISSNSISGTLTTSSQTNITTVGKLTTLDVSRNITQSSGTSTLRATTVDSLTSSGNVSIGGLIIAPSIKGSSTLSGCHTCGTEIADASNYFPNFAFSSNTQNSYVCGGSSGTTYYKAFGQGDPNTNWWQSDSTYSPSGSPSSSVSLTYSGGTSLGEWVSLTVPSGILIKPTQMWVFDNEGPAVSYTFTQCRVFGQLNGGQLYLIGSKTIAGNPPAQQVVNITLSGTIPFNVFYFQVTQLSNWSGGGVNLPASVSNIYIGGSTANYTINQTVYVPQSLEVGKTATSTLASNQLRVNGSCRTDNLFTNQLNVDSSSVFVGVVYCKSNIYGTTGDILGPFALSTLWFKDATGIPSWATEITVSLTGIKNSAGTGIVYLSLGNSDGTYSGSYQGSCFGSSTSALDSTFIRLSPDATWATAATYYGQFIFKYGGATGLAEPKAIWTYTGIMTRADGGSWWQSTCGGVAYVKSTTYVDRVKITHPNSTTPFAANAYMSVSYR
jgi:hypothetical protein